MGKKDKEGYKERSAITGRYVKFLLSFRLSCFYSFFIMV